MEAIAATAKAPLATPSAKTARTRGKPGPTKPPAAMVKSAAAERTQPATAQLRSAPARPRPKALPATATRIMAEQHAAVLDPRELGGFARGHAEDRPGEGLEDQVLGAVGQHRHEDEDREAPGLGFRPDLRQRLAEARLWRRARGRRPPGGGRARPFDPPDGDQGHGEGHAGDQSRDRDQTGQGEGIEQQAREHRRDHHPGDHHQPDRRGGGRTAGRRDQRRQKHQQRGPGGADAAADQGEGQTRQDDSGRRPAGHQSGRDGGQDGAQRQGRHPADDPGRAPAADVRAVAPARPEHLHGVVEGDQGARQHGRQGQLHHHDPVHGRGGQDDDRAQRRLHEAQPQNPEPGQGAGRHHAAPSRARALTNMPRT